MASIKEIRPPEDEGSSIVKKKDTNNRFLYERSDSVSREDLEKALCWAVEHLPRDEKFPPITGEMIEHVFANPDFARDFGKLLKDEAFQKNYGLPEDIGKMLRENADAIVDLFQNHPNRAIKFFKQCRLSVEHLQERQIAQPRVTSHKSSAMPMTTHKTSSTERTIHTITTSAETTPTPYWLSTSTLTGLTYTPEIPTSTSTSDVDNTSDQSALTKNWVLGGIVGGALLLGIMACLIMCVKRKIQLSRGSKVPPSFAPE